jgi:hypothetical protein
MKFRTKQRKLKTKKIKFLSKKGKVMILNLLKIMKPLNSRSFLSQNKSSSPKRYCWTNQQMIITPLKISIASNKSSKVMKCRRRARKVLNHFRRRNFFEILNILKKWQKRAFSKHRKTKLISCSLRKIWNPTLKIFCKNLKTKIYQNKIYSNSHNSNNHNSSQTNLNISQNRKNRDYPLNNKKILILKSRNKIVRGQEGTAFRKTMKLALVSREKPNLLKDKTIKFSNFEGFYYLKKTSLSFHQYHQWEKEKPIKCKRIWKIILNCEHALLIMKFLLFIL